MESEMYDYYRHNGSLKNEIYDWVEMAVFAVVCMVLIFTFIARTITVDGASMENTLHNEDRLINSRFLYKPAYADIVVVTKPNYLGEPLIKRIIATGGQTVDVDVYEGTVKVDGVILDEPYIPEPTYTSGVGVEYPILVPEGYVFVMGDNRNHSLDSRFQEIGLIDERYILGRVIYRIAPWSDRGHPDKAWKEKE